MENSPTEITQISSNQVHAIAADLLLNKQMSQTAVKNNLVGMGVDELSAKNAIKNIQNQIDEAEKSKANKDMIYGALWCVGGLVLTLMKTGFIFWGAIVFGGFQFLKGLNNYMKR